MSTSKLLTFINKIPRIIRYRRKQKKKLQERLKSQLDVQKDSTELATGRNRLFSLKFIKTSNQLEEIDKGDSEADGSDGEEDTHPVLIEEDYNQRSGSEEEGEESENEEEGDIELESDEEQLEDKEVKEDTSCE